MTHPNVERLTIVARRLGVLRHRVAFLGGAATNLLITDEAAPELRVTADVDVAVEVASRMEYYALESDLRRIGFMNDPDGPTCRWVVEGIPVDVMPTDSTILGFSNDWYGPAIQAAEPYEVADEVTIRLVTPPYFVATKLEAFGGRGNGDFLASRDIEDIVAIVDGRAELVQEVRDAPQELSTFIGRTIAGHLENPRFRESIHGHLPGDAVTQRRAPIVIERLSAIARLGGP